VQLEFSGEIWYWRGPAPWYFITVPDDLCRQLQSLSGLVSYGWGMIPVTVTLGSCTWKTSLFPKDGRYVLPVKAQVRRSERLDEGHTRTVQLTVET
jgi:hypothetical protein